MKSRHGGKYISLRIAAVLFLFTMLSFCIKSGLLARYNATGFFDSSARVAAFNVNVVGAPENVFVYADTENPSESYALTLVNNSEVAISYDITLTFSEALPIGTSVTLNGGGLSFSEGGKVAKASELGVLGVSESKTETFVFCADEELFASAGEGYKRTESRTFSVSVIFTQID